MRSLPIIFFSSLTLLSSASQANTLSPHFATPSYSNLTLDYMQAKIEDYADKPNGVSASFEQQLSPRFFISGHYTDLSSSVIGSTSDLELEDYQVGIGWYERSQVGPYVDLSFLVGQETLTLPDPLDPDNYFRDASEYFGAEIGLRDNHGPLEVQVGLAYLFHSSERDDQFRWSANAFLNINRYLAVGLRYQDHEEYQLQSIQLRVRW
ncbi:hypothetical protein CWE09_04680 [Aliidiomarina minuta]|uniref:Outer membrane protein beta-barrel domain-containing protein n=1 Tax=Aliidiomarina minuta TaxID=880057 RepID=A0A432W7U4_9GAMM|nr:hypothetical protein [Aliidiomarina minuta]RUO26026.1 hypothetical protein CWE09_04680 [Aliidiomarina minuta]